MIRSGHEPFDADVAAFGGYQYTRGDRLSSLTANRRYSEMILAATDYRGKRVADVGCGDGTYTIELARLSGAASVAGIDPSAPAIEAARKAAAGVPAVSFRQGTAADALREAVPFDIAVYRGVIHHVSDPAAEIADAIRLAPLVVFLEPNGWNLILKVLEKVSSYHREHGERSYTLGSHRRWVARGGGRVVRGGYFGLVPYFSPDWVVKTGAALEPLVERLPGVRVAACGQILFVARRA